MSTPCSRIAELVSEAQNVEKCYRVPAGNVLLELLGLAAGIAGKQVQFVRQKEKHLLNLSMIVSSPDAMLPSWMCEPWDEALSQQDNMERTEKSLTRPKMQPEVHRDLRRKLSQLRSLGTGFESQALQVEEKLEAAKLTANIDLLHEVARFGGQRVSERPPVGESLLVLANGTAEIQTLKKAALKPGGLWNQLGGSGRCAMSLQAWCPEGQLMSVLSPDPHAAASRIGYIMRSPEEMPVEGYLLSPRNAGRNFLALMRNRRIAGGCSVVEPVPHYAEGLDGACDSYLDGIPDGLAYQGGHLGTTGDLPWHIASLLLLIFVPDGENDDDSFVDLATLASMLARELLVGHLAFLSEIRPTGQEGILSGLHRSLAAHLARGPVALRDLERAQRYVS